MLSNLEIGVAEVSLEGKKNLQEAINYAVRLAMVKADWRRHIQPKLPTYIKFNMCWCDFLLPGMCTSPAVLQAVIDVIKDHVGPIYLIEGVAAAHQNFKKGCRINGYDLLKNCKFQVISEDHFRFTEFSLDDVPFPIKLPTWLVSCRNSHNYISIAPVKTHSVTGFTGVMKNSFGVSHYKRVLYHFYLEKVIQGINELIQPCFGILDGTVVLEGNGPANGNSRELDLIVASHDLEALDNYGRQLIADFEPAKPQKYAELMFWLMKHQVTCKVLFDWLWPLGAFGVKIIRNYWYWSEGEREVKRFLETSKYREIYVRNQE